MYLKIFLNSLLVLFLVIIQTSFISALPSHFSNLNILLLFLVYILVVGSLETALVYSVALGFLMDVFSFLYFGAYLLGFSFSIIVVNFLLANFFTNRSLYAFLALIASASVLSVFFIVIFNNIFSMFSGDLYISFNRDFFVSSVQQLGLNMLFMAIVYYLTNFLNNSFKPVFLVNKKS